VLESTFIQALKGLGSKVSVRQPIRLECRADLSQGRSGSQHVWVVSGRKGVEGRVAFGSISGGVRRVGRRGGEASWVGGGKTHRGRAGTIRGFG